MPPIPYSQKDFRWRWKHLGSSTNTIGAFGCVLTCLSMIDGRTPDVLNGILLAGGGYAQGDLINWITLHNAIPSLRLLPGGRVTHYADPAGDPSDNNVVRAHIAQYGCCIVEVDATPIGSPKGTHFVLYIGGQMCLDPWDGKMKKTSTYSATGYVLLAIA